MKPLFFFLICLAAAIPAPGQDSAARPNILFIIADDGSQHLGETYGCDWIKTPNIDKLGREGLVFDNAYVPTSKCAPCRAGLLTGRYPWQLEEAANHQHFFPAKYKSFTEAFADAGIATGSKGKTWGPGKASTDSGEARNFALPQSAFEDFLAKREKGKPFFFWYGSTNPHRSYELGAGKAQGKRVEEIDHVPAYWPDVEEVRSDLLDYATEVETFDREIGALLTTLEASGEAANTLVVVTSDHGMPFPRVKGHTYNDAHLVPLVMRWPGGIAKPGSRVGDFVSIVDLAPTFLSLHGIKDSAMSPVTGKSLTDLLAGKSTTDRSFVLIGRERNDVRARPGTPHGLGYPARGIRSGDFLYVRNFEPDRWPCGDPDLGLIDTDNSPTKSLIQAMGPGNPFWEHSFGKRPAEQLFNVKTDPDCVKNLAGDASLAETMKKLAETMSAELKRQEDPRILGRGAIFDEYPSVKAIDAPQKAGGKKAEKAAEAKKAAAPK